MKKKFFSIFFALVLVVSFSLVTAVPVAAAALAEGTTYGIVGDYYPVDFIVTDDGPTVTWTFDMIGDKELTENDLTGGGRWNYGLAISLDGEKPAFQIHNNDGTDASYEWGTHLYSPYLDGWVSSTTNTLVDSLDWVTCTGDGYIANNANGIFTVTIDKAELGLEFHWAIWCTAGGFWTVGGYSSYPEGFMWDEDVTAGHYELCSLDNTEVGLTGETEQITAISVTPSSIDFGTVTPGTPVSKDDIYVTNIGTVIVDVSAALAEAETVFEYLKLGGTAPPNSWVGITGLAGGDTADPITTLLDVPRDYSAKGEETNTLIFTVRTY